MEREDCVIAATGLSQDEPVVTGNAQHFGRIEGLELRSY